MERIPILKMGEYLLVTIQVDMHDRLAMTLQDDLTARISAVDLVKVAAEALGGKGGGGRPDMAQAGGPDNGNPSVALDAIRKKLGELAVV